MDDPLFVRPLERVGDLRAVPEHLVGRKRPLLDPIGERLAFDHLHDEEMRALLVTDVEEGADVRMIERRDRLRLTLESSAELFVLRDARGKDLDRDVAPEARVAAAIDLAHASGADGRNDFVWTESGPS